MRTRYADVLPYFTKDGCEIRELMHPAVRGNSMQSLAEATIAPGTRTRLHRHALIEALYHVSAGSGIMTLEDSRLKVGAGETVLIAPGTPHSIEATGPEPLRILCCCSPPYSHDDTELLVDA